jgi:hypothetical protein
MIEPIENWKDQTRLSLWISGYRSPLISVREVWRLTLSFNVVLLTLVVGAIVSLTMTFSHLTAGDQTFYMQMHFIVVPLIVTIASSALITVIFYFRYRTRVNSGVVPEVITVPVTLTALVACIPMIFLFNWSKYLAGGLALEWLVIVVAVFPFVYVVISDYIHFIILRYVAPSMLNREPIEPPDLPQAGSRRGIAGALSRLIRAPLYGNTKVEDTADDSRASWAERMCLSLWICGHKTSLMSVRDLWKVVFSRLVLALSIFIGSSAGVASTITLKADGDETYMYLMLFAVAPVFVNIGSAALITAYMYLRLPLRDTGSDPVIIVPSLLTVYIAAVPVIGLIYFLKVMAGGLGAEWFFYVLTVVPAAYVLISDFFHYIVFSYITPSIWDRSHVFAHATGATAEQHQKQTDARLPQIVPEVAPEVHQTEVIKLQPVYAPCEQPVRRKPEVRIGGCGVNETDLIFLEAQGNYLRIVTPTMDHLERFRISSAVDLLSDDLGIFLHRSYWVAFSGIKHVSFSQGQYRVHTTNGETINVAATRKHDVLRALTDREILDQGQVPEAIPDDRPTG